MRRARGLAAVTAVVGAAACALATLGALGAAAGLGCGHDAKPAVVEPDPHPPLPPASGTPIGYLVDSAAQLKLSDDQLGKLKTIDEELAGKLNTLDSELRAATPASSGQGSGGGRRSGGGMRGGGRRGGMRGGGMGGAGGGAGAGSGSGTGSSARQRLTGPSTDMVNRVTEERAADVRDAIDRSLALLDIVQRIAAKKVLTDHGVDLDAGRPASGAAAAKPGTPAPAAREPEPDSDSEPDEPDSGEGSGSN